MLVGADELAKYSKEEIRAVNQYGGKQAQTSNQSASDATKV